MVLKQTEDQYPVAAVWDQYMAVYNSKQGSLTNTEWYKRFDTKVKVAESIGCAFANDRTLDYCAELEHKQPYETLTAAEKAGVDIQARDRFMAYGLLKTSSNLHDKIKADCQMTSPREATTTLSLHSKHFCCWISTPRS